MVKKQVEQTEPKTKKQKKSHQDKVLGTPAEPTETGTFNLKRKKSVHDEQADTNITDKSADGPPKKKRNNKNGIKNIAMGGRKEEPIIVKLSKIKASAVGCERLSEAGSEDKSKSKPKPRKSKPKPSKPTDESTIKEMADANSDKRVASSQSGRKRKPKQTLPSGEKESDCSVRLGNSDSERTGKAKPRGTKGARDKNSIQSSPGKPPSERDLGEDLGSDDFSSLVFDDFTDEDWKSLDSDVSRATGSYTENLLSAVSDGRATEQEVTLLRGNTSTVCPVDSDFESDTDTGTYTKGKQSTDTLLTRDSNGSRDPDPDACAKQSGQLDCTSTVLAQTENSTVSESATGACDADSSPPRTYNGHIRSALSEPVKPRRPAKPRVSNKTKQRAIDAGQLLQRETVGLNSEEVKEDSILPKSTTSPFNGITSFYNTDTTLYDVIVKRWETDAELLWSLCETNDVFVELSTEPFMNPQDPSRNDVETLLKALMHEYDVALTMVHSMLQTLPGACVKTPVSIFTQLVSNSTLGLVSSVYSLTNVATAKFRGHLLNKKANRKHKHTFGEVLSGLCTSILAVNGYILSHHTGELQTKADPVLLPASEDVAKLLDFTDMLASDANLETFTNETAVQCGDVGVQTDHPLDIVLPPNPLIERIEPIYYCNNCSARSDEHMSGVVLHGTKQKLYTGRQMPVLYGRPVGGGESVGRSGASALRGCNNFDDYLNKYKTNLLVHNENMYHRMPEVDKRMMEDFHRHIHKNAR